MVIIPANKYNSAMAAIEKKDYATAYDTLMQLGGYKDSQTLLADIKTLSPQLTLTRATVGDTVVFGKYEQDNNTSNGKEDIEWKVLAKENGKVLVISSLGLDCQPYHTTLSGVTWESSTSRKWLNETFISDAFNKEEQVLIAAIIDKIFLLSIAEARKYFISDSERMMKVTAYARKQGASEDNGYGWWWLRSSGYDSNFIIINTDGSINYYGVSANKAHITVRPALWIDISNLK